MNFRFDLLNQSEADCHWKAITPSQYQYGSKVTFEGIVRNLNEGKTVQSLYYEGYPSMIVKEANLILENAFRQYDLLALTAYHRLGLLQLGELAVKIVTFSAHRSEGFQATEEVMTKIKKTLPIWKKENYLDGNSEWVYCQH